MSVNDIIAELPKLSNRERELLLQKLVDLNEEFEPSPAMSRAIKEGLTSLKENKTYSASELHARISEWITR
jgi:hypothetical protein